MTKDGCPWRHCIGSATAYNYLGSCVTQFSQKREIDKYLDWQSIKNIKTCEIEFQMTQAGMTRDLFSEKTQGRPMGEFPICEWIVHSCARLLRHQFTVLSRCEEDRENGGESSKLISRTFTRYKSRLASAETQISETILIYYRIQSLRLAFLSISSWGEYYLTNWPTLWIFSFQLHALHFYIRVAGIIF